MTRHGVSRTALVGGVLLMLTAACGGSPEGDGAPTASADGQSDSGATETTRSDTKDPLSIDFGWSTSGYSTSLYPLVAAQALGYFEDENLTVNVQFGGGSGALAEQLVAENIPVGAPAMSAVVEAVGQGFELVDFYTISYGNNFGIWVPQDSEIDDVTDLAGETLGITAPGGGEVAVVNAALEDAGVNPIEVNLVPIGEGEATTIDAIQSGRVVGYAASEFDLFSLVAQGLELREITPSDIFANMPQRGLIAGPESLDENRESLVRLGRAWAKATLFCQHNREACLGFISEAGPEAFLEENDEGESQGSLTYGAAWEYTLVPEGETFGRHKYDAMAEYLEVLAENGTIQPFDAREFMVDELLDEINDFDHEAVRAEAESFDG